MTLLTLAFLLLSISFENHPAAETPPPPKLPIEECGNGRGYMLCMTGYPEAKQEKPCDFNKGCSKTMFIDEFGNETISEIIQLD